MPGGRRSLADLADDGRAPARIGERLRGAMATIPDISTLWQWAPAAGSPASCWPVYGAVAIGTQPDEGMLSPPPMPRWSAPIEALVVTCKNSGMSARRAGRRGSRRGSATGRRGSEPGGALATPEEETKW